MDSGFHSAPAQLKVTVTSLVPDGGGIVTPLWFSAHDGSFDTFNVGEAASTGIEIIAEDGLTGFEGDFPDIRAALLAQGLDPDTYEDESIASLFEESDAAETGGVQGYVAAPSVFVGYFPGESASTVVELGENPGEQNRYFSFGAMYFPSNDAFVGNEDPFEIELFDDNGKFVGADFIVTGDQVWDAGTEVNDNDFNNVPFTFDRFGNGIPEGAGVTLHPGLTASGGGGFLDAPDPVTGFFFPNPDFAQDDFDVLRITVELVPVIENTIIGDESNNILLGSNLNDLIDGQGGNDIIRGRQGDDALWGSTGDDVIQGGVGKDDISGDAGNDRLFGEAGHDAIAGGDGEDDIRGGGGDDHLKGEGDDDAIRGGAGADIIQGDTGNDDLRGNGGDDRFIWNNGDGSDRVRGGGGNDVQEVNGNTSLGDTFELRGDSTTAIFERLDGGAGLGNFVLTETDVETFEVNGLGGNDSLKVDASLSGTDVETVIFNGGDGTDRFDANDFAGTVEVFGGSDDDDLRGGDGDDLLSGDGGDDELRGRDGEDTLDGGAGNDQLFGGRDSDVLTGGDGTDLLSGGSGADTLIDGAGSDVLTGGNGPDTFVLTGSVLSDGVTTDTVVDFQLGDSLDVSAYTEISRLDSGLTFILFDLNGEDLLFVSGTADGIDSITI